MYKVKLILGEYNDDQLRKEVEDELTIVLKAENKFPKFKVICNKENNTADIIENHKLVIYIMIQKHKCEIVIGPYNEK